MILILIVLLFLSLMRAIKGPTVADRMVAIDIIGILVVGIIALYASLSKRDFLMDLALAWIFLSFVGTIALAKVLEGKGYEE